MLHLRAIRPPELTEQVLQQLELTSKKSGALVGVLVSVTTIPAAANAAAALAY